MDKKKLSEADICAKFITPAVIQAGWDEAEQVYREYTLRPGRVVVRGQKASRDKKSVLRADYALFYKTSIPLAVIEAKDNTQAVGAGMAQAINYAELLGVPFSFASNGPAFIVLALNAGWTKDQLEAAKSGMAANQVNISQTDLRGILLPVCSKAEQNRIVARVLELRSLCAQLRERLTKARSIQSQLADALVAEAVA